MRAHASLRHWGEAGTVTWLERSPGGDHGGQDRGWGNGAFVKGFGVPCRDMNGPLGSSAVRGASVLSVALVTPQPTHVCVDFVFETAFTALTLYPP